MSDIKESVSPAGLRKRAEIMRELLDESCGRLLELAADEIERLQDKTHEFETTARRLRAALWQIDNGGSWEINQLREIARKALEGK